MTWPVHMMGPAKRDLSEANVLGVLIVIGGLILAAMFFVLYVRAIAAERRADALSAELQDLREKIGKPD